MEGTDYKLIRAQNGAMGLEVVPWADGHMARWVPLASCQLTAPVGETIQSSK